MEMILEVLQLLGRDESGALPGAKFLAGEIKRADAILPLGCGVTMGAGVIARADRSAAKRAWGVCCCHIDSFAAWPPMVDLKSEA